jgi:hypothetical protein
MTEELRCNNPHCRQPIHVVPGHRPRRYCSNACRQMTHEHRQEDQRITVVRDLARSLPPASQQAMEQLLSTYGVGAAELAFDVARHCFYEYRDINRMMHFFRSNTA